MICVLEFKDELGEHYRMEVARTTDAIHLSLEGERSIVYMDLSDRTLRRMLHTIGEAIGDPCLRAITKDRGEGIETGEME